MTDQISNAALIAATDQYKEQREAIKAIQKQELEDVLLPWKYSLGRAIVHARSQRGLTVQEVGAIIGIQNRTFIYEMIRAYETGPDILPQTPTPTPTPTPEDTDAAPYRIEWLDDSDTAHIIFAEDEEYYVTVDNGFPELPEEWSEHTKERRALYKEIIAAIRARYKKN